MIDLRPMRDTYQWIGSTIYNTADCGAVTATLSASGVELTTFRPSR